jgi:hypothetical protein
MHLIVTAFIPAEHIHTSADFSLFFFFLLFFLFFCCCTTASGNAAAAVDSW